MTMQVIDDRAVTEIRMRRPLGVLRNACAQLPFHEQILDEAYKKGGAALPKTVEILESRNTTEK